MAEPILASLQARGVALQAEGNRIKARGKLDDEARTLISANKAAILAALSKPQSEDAITQQQHRPTVPVDALGYPFKPCSCGARHFWSADGKVWHCSDCCPDHALLVDTLTL